jgi:hypothetical protein
MQALQVVGPKYLLLCNSEQDMKLLPMDKSQAVMQVEVRILKGHQ